jgi:hypothetical protein
LRSGNESEGLLSKGEMDEYPEIDFAALEVLDFIVDVHD